MRPEIRIAFIYATVGVLWKLFSDALVTLLFSSNPMLLAMIQANKGFLYIFATALLLYLVLHREFQQREEQEKKFRLLFNHNPNPMWVYDVATLNFLEVNEAAMRRYGYPRDQFLNMTLKDIRPPEEVPKLLQSLADGSGTQPIVGERRHRTRDGKIIYADISTQPFEYHGQPQMLVVAQDVTERKELEAERNVNLALRIQLEREQESHNTRSRFFSMVSHEFRTPLATITSSSSLLQRYDDRLSAEKRLEYYQKILKQAHLLSEQLDEMLLLLRTELASANYQPQPADIVELCQEVVETFAMTVPASRSLTFETSHPKMTIDMDRKLMWRVVTNLVSNALKYSPDNKSVSVSLYVDEQGVQICVKDEGIGIPPAQQQQLFEPFFRAHNAEDIQGTGLGLTIVKQAVELHSGTIHVESDEGQGTCFTINLPLLQPYVVEEVL